MNWIAQYLTLNTFIGYIVGGICGCIAMTLWHALPPGNPDDDFKEVRTWHNQWL